MRTPKPARNQYLWQTTHKDKSLLYYIKVPCLEWASPSQWRIGHVLNLAVRPNERRNVWYEVHV